MLIPLPNAFGDAVTNMAIDAALLASMPAGLAAFRHYGWLEPSLSFGYAQRYDEVAQNSAPELSLIRRLTGGGIVDHRNDWTYALILHSSLAASKRPATELYQQIHQAIQQTLQSMQIETQLAPCPKACKSRQPTPSSISSVSQCFVNPAVNDVLRLDGQKIAGAAMKRSRAGLLIQGSIDRSALPEDFDFAHFQPKLLIQLSQALELAQGELEDIRPLFKSEQIQQEKERFASKAWNQKRV